MDDDALRPAELMGQWYPARPEACEALFAEWTPATSEPGLGAVVPHAGWVYSGRVAYEALLAAAAGRPDADLVVLFGGHLTPRDPIRVFLEGGWQTPFGPAVMPEALARDVALGLPESDPETPEEYYEDNAIEVLMPMVRHLWPQAPVLVVGVPPTTDASRIGAEVVDRLEQHGFHRPVVVGSTDLTHYGPNYRFHAAGHGHEALEWVKTKNDPAVIDVMARLDAGSTVRIAREARNACCPGAAAAALAAARKLGATRGEVVRYTTSWDVRPSSPVPQSFVGYVGLALR